ncbi:helix-turn-helix transcriptional regulator [Oerskovia sp. NPDC060287]|uniref:helix-turn-helix transcriptional regulator n=1 Tax=Oerskovia sp. NPDC060287 TaxID=3347095 RepID=UPI00365081D4
MDLKAETRDFLTTRRARITPDRAGLPAYGTNRRVPGLRREEVAMLAGVSVDYYTRLERGSLGGVSEEVLEALAQALQLDEAEHRHLFDLARAANASGAARSRARRAPAPVLRPAVQRILDAMDGAPAFVRNGRLDVLGTNSLGRALYAPIYDSPERIANKPVNTARFQFLDPDAAREFWGDRYDRIAHDAVAILRAEAGKNPFDSALTALVGELSTRSEDFRRLWASHDVRLHRTGTKIFHHPVVGRLELDYEALELPADAGLQLNVYTAVPGSPSDDGLKLLASWAATRAVEAGGTAAEGHGVRADAPASTTGPTGRPTTTPTEKDL